MRFCVHCGNALQPVAPAHVASPSASALAPTPVQAQPSPVRPPVVDTVPGPVCWRCRGVGDAGTEFCKFCGARYADGGDGRQPKLTSSGPHEAVRPAVPTVHEAVAQARLVSILKDGSDGAIFPLSREQADIGRREGDVVLADDPYLSPRHARLRKRGNDWVLQDLDSVNGVYFRLREPVELRDHDSILLGQQVLRFELLEDTESPLGPASFQGVLAFGTPEVPRYARLVQYTTEGVGRDVHYLYRDETVLGRETGDVVFTDDPFLSRRHAAISVDRPTKRVTLRDLGSSNGTAIRLRAERPLVNGDQFRVGRHLFRFDAGQR